MATFCKAFANHLCVTITQQIKPCCRFDLRKQREYGRPITELPDILLNPLWVDASNSSFSQMAGCHRCMDEETAEIKSLRNDMNDRLSGGDKIELLEISPSADCNLSCRMCSNDYSNSWALIAKNNPEIARFGLASEKTEKMNLRLLETVDLSHLKRIKYLGGEPFVSPMMDDFIELLEHNDSIDKKNIVIELFTNATMFPEKRIKKLEHFKQIIVHLSIDGIGELGEYIRTGSDWGAVNKSLNKWLLTDFDVSVITTVQSYNIHQIPLMWRFFDELGTSMNMHFLYYPMHLSVFCLPDKYKASVSNDIGKSDIPDDIKKFLISTVNKECAKPDKFVEFLDFTKTMDGIHRTDIKTVIPMMGEYFD